MTSTPDPMPQDFTQSQDFKGFASPEAKKRKGQKTAEKYEELLARRFSRYCVCNKEEECGFCNFTL